MDACDAITEIDRGFGGIALSGEKFYITPRSVMGPEIRTALRDERGAVRSVIAAAERIPLADFESRLATGMDMLFERELAGETEDPDYQQKLRALRLLLASYLIASQRAVSDATAQ